jgi:hypothetical protein
MKMLPDSVFNVLPILRWVGPLADGAAKGSLCHFAVSSVQFCSHCIFFSDHLCISNTCYVIPIVIISFMSLVLPHLLVFTTIFLLLLLFIYLLEMKIMNTYCNSCLTVSWFLGAVMFWCNFQLQFPYRKLQNEFEWMVLNSPLYRIE